MNCIATQCHGDGFTNKLTCNICGGVVHKGTSRAQRGLIIIALGHLKKYHNSHHRNIFPMVELYINYGVDPQETDKRMVAEYLVDNPQPLFLSKVSDSSFPNGNMFFVDDYDTTIQILLNSQYNCILCGGEFDVLPTKNMLLGHLKCCVANYTQNYFMSNVNSPELYQ